MRYSKYFNKLLVGVLISIIILEIYLVLFIKIYYRLFYNLEIFLLGLCLREFIYMYNGKYVEECLYFYYMYWF